VKIGERGVKLVAARHLKHKSAELLPNGFVDWEPTQGALDHQITSDNARIQDLSRTALIVCSLGCGRRCGRGGHGQGH
jgi:hypothetical protein